MKGLQERYVRSLQHFQPLLKDHFLARDYNSCKLSKEKGRKIKYLILICIFAVN